MMLVGCFSLHPHLALRVTFENQYTTESCLPFPKVAIKAHDHRDDRHPEQTDGPQRPPGLVEEISAHVGSQTWGNAISMQISPPFLGNFIS